ncbi:MAG: hypothetical protein ACYDBQ_10235 [Thermoplasmatota archaeon]
MVAAGKSRKVNDTIAEKRRRTLVRNVRRGKSSEVIGRAKLAFGYDEIERTGVGSDYRGRRTTPWTGEKSRWKHFEIKSSPTAPVSPRQKKSRAKVLLIRPDWP